MTTLGRSHVMAITKPGCPACEASKPAVSRAKKTVSLAEVNADKNPSIIEKYGVEAFPDFVYKTRQGKVHRMPWSGIPTATDIVKWVDTVKQGKAAANTGAKNACTQCGNADGVPPSVWGPPLWFVIHIVALMYPQNPSATERRQMIDFFTGLQPVLPCSYCKKHFAQELSTMDPAVFDSRDALFEWTVAFHQSVSDRTQSTQPRKPVSYWRNHYKSIALYAVHQKKLKGSPM